VDKSERLAKLAPDDPEAMPMLGQQAHKQVEAFFPSVAAMTAEDRARVALTALEPARGAKDLRAAGFLINAGHSVRQQQGHVCLSPAPTELHLTVRTDGTGSGWAGAEHNVRARWTSPPSPHKIERRLRGARSPSK
jgi:hypothetical protein